MVYGSFVGGGPPHFALCNFRVLLPLLYIITACYKSSKSVYNPEIPRLPMRTQTPYSQDGLRGPNFHHGSTSEPSWYVDLAMGFRESPRARDREECQSFGFKVFDVYIHSGVPLCCYTLEHYL